MPTQGNMGPKDDPPLWVKIIAWVLLFMFIVPLGWWLGRNMVDWSIALWEAALG